MQGFEHQVIHAGIRTLSYTCRDSNTKPYMQKFERQIIHAGIRTPNHVCRDSNTNASKLAFEIPFEGSRYFRRAKLRAKRTHADIYLPLKLYVAISISICLPICHPFYLYLYQSIDLYQHLSIYIYIHL